MPGGHALDKSKASFCHAQSAPSVTIDVIIIAVLVCSAFTRVSVKLHGYIFLALPHAMLIWLNERDDSFAVVMYRNQ